MKRREFIKKSAWGTTGVTLMASAGTLTSCTVNGANKKIALALIGSGTRGIEIAKGLCKTDPNVTLKYICDVNENKANNGIQTFHNEFGYLPQSAGKMKQVFEDKEVDAVIIATPDHWHTLATIHACQSDKDVYVEANPTLCLWEGKKMMEASKKYKRIVQVGFQNRSAASVASAKDFIKSGQLGQVVHIKAYNIFGGSAWVPSEDTEIPKGLDWDSWLGPAPYRPYNPGITGIDKKDGWDNFWAFSGGPLSVRASHVLDTARAVIGDPGHPAFVYCCGGNRIWNSACEVPEIQEITYNYGKFTLTCESYTGASYMKNFPASALSDEKQFPDWLRISDRLEVYGSKGLMYIASNGGGWQVIGPEDKVIAEEHDVNPDILHWKNFINCIRTRQDPYANAEQGHLSASLVHLGNIAYRVGNKKLSFDGAKEEFTNNPEANSFLKSTYREGYTIPEKV